MAKATSGTFKFKRGDSIGSVDAENDPFLHTCFVDRGDAEVLLDCQNPKCIIVGRTGSGKSALLLEIEKRVPGHIESILPDALSLNYIANSDVVSVLSRLGVNLDPFFKLLWRHVLALHIFQHLRPVTDAEKSQGLIAWVTRCLRADKTTAEKAARHKRVLEFLDKYGGQEFWGDVGHRVQQIVYKFEQEVETLGGTKAGMSGGVSHGPLKLSAHLSGSESQRDKQNVVTEITVQERQRFQSIVNEMQLRELTGILDLIAEVLDDAGRNVYIVIDKLDLQWADESIRFRLIRALIDTVIAFAAVPRAKIILAMRIDLVERVYRDAKHEPGTQSEKVKDYCLFLSWDRGSLVELIDERVNKLVADRYAPNYRVTLKDVVNPKIRKGRQQGANSVDFILERTWSRPRDMIDFLNECIKRAAGRAKISDDAMMDAEGDYSRSRLRALGEEWQLEYPYLDETLRKLLSGKPRRFRVSELADELLYEWMELIWAHPEREGDRIRPIATALNDHAKTDETRVQLAAIMYKVGALGVQTDEAEKPQWASNFSYSLSANEIKQDSWIYVHPGLWKALAIQ